MATSSWSVCRTRRSSASPAPRWDKTAYGKGTFKTFGCKDAEGYLHKYSIADSIEDGTTLPLPGGVPDIAMSPDDSILIAGSFAKEGGENRLLIARLNPDGSLDHSFGSPLQDWQISIVSTIRTAASLSVGASVVAGGTLR